MKSQRLCPTADVGRPGGTLAGPAGLCFGTRRPNNCKAASERSLTMLWQNLLGNAIKYRAEEARRTNLRIASARVGTSGFYKKSTTMDMGKLFGTVILSLILARTSSSTSIIVIRDGDNNAAAPQEELEELRDELMIVFETKVLLDALYSRLAGAIVDLDWYEMIDGMQTVLAAEGSLERQQSHCVPFENCPVCIVEQNGLTFRETRLPLCLPKKWVYTLLVDQETIDAFTHSRKEISNGCANGYLEFFHEWSRTTRCTRSLT